MHQATAKLIETLDLLTQLERIQWISQAGTSPAPASLTTKVHGTTIELTPVPGGLQMTAEDDHGRPLISVPPSTATADLYERARDTQMRRRSRQLNMGRELCFPPTPVEEAPPADLMYLVARGLEHRTLEGSITWRTQNHPSGSAHRVRAAFGDHTLSNDSAVTVLTTAQDGIVIGEISSTDDQHPRAVSHLLQAVQDNAFERAHKAAPDAGDSDEEMAAISLLATII